MDTRSVDKLEEWDIVFGWENTVEWMAAPKQWVYILISGHCEHYLM